MKRPMATFLAVLALVGCKEDSTSLPQPVDMTAEAVGYYCQMELLTHDGPKGQIHLDGMPAPIFFSQVRDAIAYLHMPEQSHAIQVAYVQDMAGSQSWSAPGDWMAMTDAIYVIGSDRMGGMGAPEYVPFSTETAAADFAAGHGGIIMRFDDIRAEDVLAATDSEPTAENQTDIAGRLRALTSEDRSN